MSKLFAIMFAGGANVLVNNPRYKNDLQLVADTVIKLQDAAAERLKFLWADGSHVFKVQGNDIQSIPATKDNLRLAMEELSSEITETDKLFFRVSNHGGSMPNTQRVKLFCWDEEIIKDTEFAALCDTVSSKLQVYILGQCNSGGFIEPLKSPSRLIMTACRGDQPSWASQDKKYDEFILRVVQAIEGGATTYSQVFQLAVHNDTRPEEPQISDLGDLASNPELLVR